MLKDTKNNIWICLIDYLKALAICLVIVNHSLPAEARGNWWFFYIVRMAVPVFVLISGLNFAISIQRAGTLSAWYSGKRLIRKMSTYLLPMIVVYGLWLIKELSLCRFDFLGSVKALVLQSYGQGAYYFWIIVQLYLLFPLVYYMIGKYKGGGIFTILIFNIIYEIVLYLIPIPQSLYRIMAFRYVTLLALGCWAFEKMKDGNRKITNPILLAVCFLAGCFYIAFFSLNREDTEIFRYTTWGNTNVFSCLYIAPLFYITLASLKDSKIHIEWLHKLVSTIGKSSYYILCTQMIMFWLIGKIWNRMETPLAINITCNIVLSVVAGVFVQTLLRRYKSIHKRRISPKTL